MNMMSWLSVVALCFSILLGNAQESVKGSRNVTVVQTPLEPFTAMEIGQEFEVVIVKGQEAMMEIETDDNLHEVIDVDVIGGTLYVQTTKEIRRSKRLRVRITFTDALTEIRVKEKARVSGLTDLLIHNLTVKTNNDGEFFATVEAHSFELINNDDAKVELNIEADTIKFQLNQKSKVDALINTTNFKADLLEDAEAKIEGDTQEFNLRADNSSRFTGEKLTSKTCTVIIEGSSKASVKVVEVLNITAKDSSELSIYDNPKFNIIEFADEAKLLKKY